MLAGTFHERGVLSIRFGIRVSYLLETIRHRPPFPDLRVLAHSLHVAGVVVPYVLEGRV